MQHLTQGLATDLSGAAGIAQILVSVRFGSSAIHSRLVSGEAATAKWFWMATKQIIHKSLDGHWKK